jgi:hypothetical protein
VERRQPPVDLLGAHRQVSRRIGATTLAAVGLLLVGACSDGSGPAGEAATAGDRTAQSASPSTEATPTADTPATTPPAPEAGACYDLPYEEAIAPTTEAEPVACRESHTAQTYHVGRLRTVVDGHLLAVDSDHAQRQVARTCRRTLDEYLGGDRETRTLSRLHAVWFSPTLEEYDAGATWFRCDVVALDRADTLAPLPPPRRLRGLLDRPGGLAQMGLCGTSAPGAPGFERVICSRRHAWRAISTIDLAGGAAYPGVGAVRKAGAETCRDQVREASRTPERFRYGWEWPTRAQWRDGQRYGFCWAPD